LYCCYELHYRGFAGVDPAWEWSPEVLSWRGHLERSFEAALRDEVGPLAGTDAVDELHRIVQGPGPSLSGYMEQRGTAQQMREFVVHRSPYQLKEADPHTWAIPRLHGRAKAAMVQLQADEYGGGVEPAMHATLFADTMAELDLDQTYGCYLDLVPGFTLATTNVISFFGLHRRLRGALVGHLALFEMTSVGPMGRYARALTRLGWGPRARRFYDVHVEADEIHQVVAAEELVRPLVAGEPELAADVAFGARAASVVEAHFAGSLLAAWDQDRTSLRRPLPQG
jgi:hypothetical protein